MKCNYDNQSNLSVLYVRSFAKVVAKRLLDEAVSVKIELPLPGAKL